MLNVKSLQQQFYWLGSWQLLNIAIFGSCYFHDGKGFYLARSCYYKLYNKLVFSLSLRYLSVVLALDVNSDKRVKPLFLFTTVLYTNLKY